MSFTSDRLDAAYDRAFNREADKYFHIDEPVEKVWACMYCGKPVPDGIEPSMFDCCGERGHVDLLLS